MLSDRIALVLGLTACAGAQRAQDTAHDVAAARCWSGDVAQLEVGYGADGFVPAASLDEPIAVIQGPQGGYHSFIGLRALGMDGSETWPVELEGRVDGELVGHTWPNANMSCNRQDFCLEATGLLLIWNVPPSELEGVTVQVDATAEDPSGQRASGSAEFMLSQHFKGEASP